MSAGKKKRAARSPRAATPKGDRPWYAPRPRWYADQVTPGGFANLMRRDKTPYVARVVASCDSLIEAGRVLGDEPTFAPGGQEVAR